MAWNQQFYNPIPLPDGRQLVTLRDAAKHYLALPNDEQKDPRWVTALETLMLVGQDGGDPMLPRIAMMQALYREPVAPAPRRKHVKSYRIIR